MQKKIFILGAARSGISAARLLQQFGAHIFVSEKNKIPNELCSALKKEGIPFEENGHNIQNLCEHFDILVVSPGIPLSSEVIVKARLHNLTVMSEVELALQFLNPKTKIVGITGTNGKSTTTHYLAHLLSSSGFQGAACGNIGTPLSEIIQHKNDYDALSIELSSYQLESGISKKFDACILLNLQNDHLVRHKTFENYLQAKWNLILAANNNALCIIDESVLKMAYDFGFSLPTCKITGTTNSTIEIQEPCLIGAHNAINIYAASLAAMHIGVSKETVQVEWEKKTSHYKSLAHRLEVVPSNTPSTARVFFINDSKATNVESTLVALKSIPTQTHLLLGGEPKGDSYLPLAEFFGKNVKRVYPFGKAGNRIYEELKNFDIFLETPSHGMIAASQKALKNSKAGDTILLSPACSSFDEFNNFEHRGDIFKAWVNSTAFAIKI